MLTEIYLDIHAAILGLSIACWAVLWVDKLTVDTWANWLYQWYGQMKYRPWLIRFLEKPLFECATCHAGWISIIVSLYLYYTSFFILFHCFVTVVISMATAFLFSHLINSR